MLAKVLPIAAVLLLCVQVSWAQNPTRTTSLPGDEGHAANLGAAAPSMIGTWKAPTERLPLTGDFNDQVWGKNAVSVRDVTLSVKPTGDAVLVQMFDADAPDTSADRN